MEWEYWDKEKEDILSRLLFEERQLRLILKRYYPDEEKKLKVIYSSFSKKDRRHMAFAHTDMLCIEINKDYLFRVSIEENIDTLKHEFAHIFSFCEIGDVWIKKKGKDVDWPHNKNWKKWCRFLGCRPTAMADVKHLVLK